jgi:hypothetical protein
VLSLRVLREPGLSALHLPPAQHAAGVSGPADDRSVPCVFPFRPVALTCTGLRNTPVQERGRIGAALPDGSSGCCRLLMIWGLFGVRVVG